MEKVIKSRHVTTTISIANNNGILAKRVLHSDNNTYYHIQPLYRYLSDRGVDSHSGFARNRDVESIAAAMAETAEIERAIDRALGEHEGIKHALEAELDAAVAAAMSEQEIQDTIDRAVADAIAHTKANLISLFSGNSRLLESTIRARIAGA